VRRTNDLYNTNKVVKDDEHLSDRLNASLRRVDLRASGSGPGQSRLPSVLSSICHVLFDMVEVGFASMLNSFLSSGAFLEPFSLSFVHFISRFTSQNHKRHFHENQKHCLRPILYAENAESMGMTAESFTL
jgi:hypothetical protein